MRHTNVVSPGHKTQINPSHWSPRLEPRNHDICMLYAVGRYTTEHLAARFGLSRGQVQRIAKQGGVIRTRAEGNRVSAPLKRKHRIRL